MPTSIPNQSAQTELFSLALAHFQREHYENNFFSTLGSAMETYHKVLFWGYVGGHTTYQETAYIRRESTSGDNLNLEMSFIRRQPTSGNNQY